MKAVVLAAYQRPDDVLAALKAGACGFLRQDIPGEWLIKSLELITHSEMVVYSNLPVGKKAIGPKDRSPYRQMAATSHLSRHSDSRSSTPFQSVTTEPSSESQAGDVARSLSHREMSVLRALMEGASNKVIALKLVMTESTVKVHVKAILRKLRLQNRTQAAVWARDHSSELTSCARESLERTSPRSDNRAGTLRGSK